MCINNMAPNADTSQSEDQIAWYVLLSPPTMIFSHLQLFDYVLLILTVVSIFSFDQPFLSFTFIPCPSFPNSLYIQLKLLYNYFCYQHRWILLHVILLDSCMPGYNRLHSH